MLLTPLFVPLVAVFAPSRPLSPSFGQSLEPRRCDPNAISEVCQVQSNHKAPIVRRSLITAISDHPQLPPCTGGATPRDKPPRRGDRYGAPPPWRLRGRGCHLLVCTSPLRGDTTSHVNARARAPGGAGGRSDAHRARATRTEPQRDSAPLAARWRLFDGERGANSIGRGAGACRKAAPPWAAPQSPTRGLPWHGHTLVLTGWLPALGRSAGAALPPFNTRRW